MTSQLFTLGPFRVWYDADLNRQIYSQILTGGPEKCNCEGCAAFIDMRETLYSPEFKQLLASLGIDYRKETEVVTYGLPGEPPLQGWYNFVGCVESGGDTLYNLTDDLQLEFCNGGVLPPAEFKDNSLVKLEWQWPPFNLTER